MADEKSFLEIIINQEELFFKNQVHSTRSCLPYGMEDKATLDKLKKYLAEKHKDKILLREVLSNQKIFPSTNSPR